MFDYCMREFDDLGRVEKEGGVKKGVRFGAGI